MTNSVQLKLCFFGHERAETIVGKGDNASNIAAFSPFPIMFLKDVIINIFVTTQGCGVRASKCFLSCLFLLWN